MRMVADQQPSQMISLAGARQEIGVYWKVNVLGGEIQLYKTLTDRAGIYDSEWQILHKC